MSQPAIRESAINVISEGTRIEGRIVFDEICRVHGTLVGEVRANPGSTLILAEPSVVEGNIHADVLIVDGYVRGDVVTRTRIVVSSTGRLIGNVTTPSLKLEFGSYFEGACTMDEKALLKEGP
ncbi:MAG: polymer-forming cytoskeletal protein [Oligoflexia bacterium]|nr:polymer-forming cytoskeletal protein [Oligoflexia bacterium]